MIPVPGVRLGLSRGQTSGSRGDVADICGALPDKSSNAQEASLWCRQLADDGSGAGSQVAAKAGGKWLIRRASAVSARRGRRWHAV